MPFPSLAADMVSVGIGPAERIGAEHYLFDTSVDIDLAKILADIP